LKPVKIGLCGLGTVGSGVFNVLQRNVAAIQSRAACEISVGIVGARRDNPACDLSHTQVERDIFAVAADPSVDIVVELIGGTTVAKDLVLSAIENGKQVWRPIRSNGWRVSLTVLVISSSPKWAIKTAILPMY